MLWKKNQKKNLLDQFFSTQQKFSLSKGRAANLYLTEEADRKGKRAVSKSAPRELVVGFLLRLFIVVWIVPLLFYVPLLPRERNQTWQRALLNLRI